MIKSARCTAPVKKACFAEGVARDSGVHGHSHTWVVLCHSEESVRAVHLPYAAQALPGVLAGLVCVSDVDLATHTQATQATTRCITV